MVEHTDSRDPVFKGCTRPAMLFGVPLVPLAAVTLVVTLLSLWTTLFCLFILPLLIFSMRYIAKDDDQQFRLLSLKLLFRFFNRNRLFWKASVYSPFVFKKRK